MLIDTHVHVGQFNSHYYSPVFICRLMKRVGVDYFAISSTTQCGENYTKVLEELHQLISSAGERALPVMWITSEGIKGNIAYLLESDIKWKCIKIHPSVQEIAWTQNRKHLNEVIDIAKELNIPLMIHTGVDGYCRSSLFREFVAENSDVTFILAHGRPLGDALALAQSYDNVFTDSAFMSLDEMQQFTDNGLSHKLLWGTDMPIPKYYHPYKSMPIYYKRKLKAFRGQCTLKQFEQITYINAAKLFNLNL